MKCYSSKYGEVVVWPPLFTCFPHFPWTFGMICYMISTASRTFVVNALAFTCAMFLFGLICHMLLFPCIAMRDVRILGNWSIMWFCVVMRISPWRTFGDWDRCLLYSLLLLGCPKITMDWFASLIVVLIFLLRSWFSCPHFHVPGV